MEKQHLAPLVIFLLLVALLGIGLGIDPKKLPSPLLNRSLPQFSERSLLNPERIISNANFEHHVIVLNVWASWCVACLDEHILLQRLTPHVAVYGLNYKDQRKAAVSWLRQWGNPFTEIIYDTAGRIGIDLGITGVPETFVIDAAGIVRRKYVGPLTAELISGELLPLITQLGQTPHAVPQI